MVYHCHKKIYYQINSILSNLFYLAMNFFLIFIVLIITQLCCRQYPGTRQGMDGNVFFISAFMCSVCFKKISHTHIISVIITSHSILYCSSVLLC